MPCRSSIFLAVGISVLIAGCAVGPLSERVLGQKFPAATDATGDGLALIAFSADKKYEAEKGVPIFGDPLVCARGQFMRVNGGERRTGQVKVKGGEEIIVTSVIQWVNTGWQKTCWPFVAFTPASGSTYTVVNERVGGKGAAALWTGVGRQSCDISVYRETLSGFERVAARESYFKACQSAN